MSIRVGSGRGQRGHHWSLRGARRLRFLLNFSRHDMYYGCAVCAVMYRHLSVRCLGACQEQKYKLDVLPVVVGGAGVGAGVR